MAAEVALVAAVAVVPGARSGPLAAAAVAVGPVVAAVVVQALLSAEPDAAEVVAAQPDVAAPDGLPAGWAWQALPKVSAALAALPFGYAPSRERRGLLSDYLWLEGRTWSPPETSSPICFQG